MKCIEWRWMRSHRRLCVYFYKEKSTEKPNWAGDFRQDSIFSSDILTVGVLLLMVSV